LQLHSYAERIRNADLETVAGPVRTGDLGGKASTTEFTAAICERLRSEKTS